MENDQPPRRINVQVGAADEYIAVVDAEPNTVRYGTALSPMNKFHDIYGFYPKYPVWMPVFHGSYNYISVNRM